MTEKTIFDIPDEDETQPKNNPAVPPKAWTPFQNVPRKKATLLEKWRKAGEAAKKALGNE